MAGVRAVEALPWKLAPKIKNPMTAVGVERVRQQSAGFSDFLGYEDNGETGRREFSGRRLEATVYCQVASPAELGGGRCFREGLRVMDALLAGAHGLGLGEIGMDRCRYEPKTDQFQCTVTAQVLAAAVLAPETLPEDAMVEDFRLEGELT